MAASETLTFDIVPPRRPAVEDIDPTLVDDAEYPPVAGDPYADQLNQMGLLIQRACALIPVAIFSVRFSAGTPILDSFSCAPTAPITGTFTITDNGTGDVSITWPANTFPTELVKSMATITENVAALAPATVSIANGVRVRTRNPASALADIAFTVAVY